MKMPSAPPPPDPYATARAQTDSNVATGIANTVMGNANEISPYGTVIYNDRGGQIVDGREIPRYERVVTLAPEQQRMLDQQNALGIQMNDLASGELGRLKGVLDTPIGVNLPAAGQLPTYDRMSAGPNYRSGAGEFQRDLGPTDFSADRQRVEASLFDRLNPQLARDRASLETRLVNQGLTRGSEAFNASMDEANRATNDARLGVISAGGQEQERLLGMAVARGQFANQAATQEIGLFNDAAARNWADTQAATAFNNQVGAQTYADQTAERERALQEQFAFRNQPINQISALMNGGQVTAPQFTQYRPGGIEGTPVGQYVYNSAQLAQDAWKTRTSAQASMMGSIFGLGSSALTAGIRSDRRLKRDIRPLGVRLRNGLSLYAYRYIDSPDRPQVGVMADEVDIPGAVMIGRDGFATVDYARVV